MTLHLANSSWDDAEIIAAKKVLDSGKVTMGKEVKDFEKQFSNYVGGKYSVMCNSGSSANLLSIAALCYSSKYDIKAGDEVIVPAVSWSTTFYPFCQYNLKLKFVDIDLNTFNYDLEKLRNSITKQTKIIVAVNLLGNPNDFDQILDIIDKRPDIILIEDNCESLGATYKGKYTGTFGTIGTFSSYFSHHISTIEGGLCVTDDEELYQIMLSLRSHGWTRDLPKKNHIVKKNEDSFFEMFNFILPGYNLRPLELSGAIGIEQLKKLPKLIKTRRENADYLKNLFSSQSNVTIQQEIGESSWFGFGIIVKENAPFQREELLRELSAQGIEFRPIVSGDFTQMPVMKYLDHEPLSNLENASMLNSYGFYIGNHHFCIKKELDLVAKIIDSLSHSPH